MFDMSWGEIMVIGGVALIVIGPKDLPKALRTVGQMTTKVRRMAGEFQSQFHEAMREAELDDVRKEVEGLNRDVASATSSTFNPLQTIRDEIKGSVEGRPGPVAQPEWTPGQAGLTAGPVEETGPVPHLETMTASAPVSVPAEEPYWSSLPEPPPADLSVVAEIQPLVPLPSDEPALPAADPSRLATGPGLEPMAESEMPKGAAA